MVQPVPVKPFLKWAGGKRQLLPGFLGMYPPALKLGAINYYYEPFAGSGAVFFDIAQRYQLEHAFLFDVNADLVLTYRMLQAHASALTGLLYQLQQEYLALDKPARLAYFYTLRDAFNAQVADKTVAKNTQKGIKRAAQFIFLNRTCYNGLFRVNSKGLFNTPAGDYVNPCICDEENLAGAAALLANATIRQADFTRILKDIRPDSFVYFDPPYRPVSTTANFTAYSKTAFTDLAQRKLARVYRELDNKGAAVMLSNSDTGDGFFEELYSGFRLQRVPAKRLINADASKRGSVNEIVITNYAR